MKIVFLDECDFVNYKEPSMFIGFPKCSYKCNIEQNKNVCQNCTLTSTIEIPVDKLVSKYQDNPFTSAIVFGGLEPFDTPNDLQNLIHTLREVTDDVIVIYTGYTKEECLTGSKYNLLLSMCYNRIKDNYKNIIVKYGRYIPNQEKHFDNVLGVYLASDNQYAERIS